MKKLSITIGLLLLSLLHVGAQEFCGTDRLHRQQMAQDPQYKAAYEQVQKKWADWDQMDAVAKRVITGTDTSFEIPVVFHILHTGQPVGSYFNPPKATIDSLMDYLNRVWDASWPAFPKPGAGGVRMPLQFKLAQRDPDCNPTDGIVRVDASSLPNYDAYGVNYDYSTPAPSDVAVKSLSRWPPGDYYNIWIVRYIDGPDSKSVSGYAYFPNPYISDGTVLAAKYIYPLATTGTYHPAIPHELGHAYLLLHTFEGDWLGLCPADTNCAINGDEVCDTEPHKATPGTCPLSSDINECTGLPYQGVQYNLMNYSSCIDRFSPMQRERVKMIAHTLRPGLNSSLGAIPPDPAFVAPKAACIPGIDSAANLWNIGVQSVFLADMTAFSYGYWSDDNKAHVDKVCRQQAHLVKGQTYPLMVSTGGNYKEPRGVRVWIDYNDNGNFETSELVFAHDGSLVGYAEEQHNGSILVPATGVVLDKPLRMRVKGDINSALGTTACDKLRFGQVEDYAVYISSDPTAVVDPAAAYQLSVAPNPASNTVTVTAALPVNIAVCGMDGRVLLQQNSQSAIQIGGLADGLYILRVTDAADGRLVKNEKLIKATK